MISCRRLADGYGCRSEPTALLHRACLAANQEEHVMCTRCYLGTIVAFSLLAPRLVNAEEAVAIAAGNNLLVFDTANPGATTIRAVVGLDVNETIRGIDYFATTGDLLACTVTTGSASNSTIKAYRINPATGEAVLLGSAGAIAGAADIPTGFDNNPTVGRLRYVNTNDE